MLDKLAGYKTQIRVLEKKLKEMDHSKLNPAKVKEITEAIQNLKDIVKEKDDKREERRKKKEEAAKVAPAEEAPKVEASTEVSGEVKKPELEYNSSTIVNVETKEASVEKFAIDSKVEPIRGTPGSIGVVIREAGVNGDPLVYVKWMEGNLKTAHGEYGAYYPSDLRLKVEAKSPTDYVPREQVYNLEADLKGNYEQSIKHLEEEIQQAKDKADYAWLGRLEQKLEDMKKAYDERFPKQADENGSGGTEKLKVVDLTPAHDKDPQEKSTGYGGDRPMGAMVAPNSYENSLPLESSLKVAFDRKCECGHKWDEHRRIESKVPCTECDCASFKAVKEASFKKGAKDDKLCWWSGCDKEATHLFQGGKEDPRSGQWCDEHFKKLEEKAEKKASLTKESINITVAEKLFVVNPLGKTADNEYQYDVNLANGNKLFKLTSKDEMGQEHLAYVIEKEILNHKEAAIKKHYAVYVNDSLATRTITKQMAEKIAQEKFPQEIATGKCKIVKEEYPQQPASPTMAKLTSNLAFLKKGSFVSILGVDKERKQVKFAALDNSIHGWAPMSKFSAMNVPEAKLMDHEGHKDEVLAESGNELLVSCPSGSSNVVWRAVEAPPATPESLNPDVASLKEARGCDQCNAAMINGVFCHETGCPNQRKQRDLDDEPGYVEEEASQSKQSDYDVKCGCDGKNKDCKYCKGTGKVTFTGALNKDAHIRHEDGKWVVYNHDYTKKLGTYDTEAEAKKRLAEIEYFKHQGSLKPLSKKEADLQDTKCEGCGEPLGPEVFLSKWPVCGKCTKKRHEKAVRKRADQDISLEQQVQGFKDRMQAVNERLSNPPVKTADLETTQDLSKVDVKDLSEGILHMIDLLESKTGENVSADPELHPMLEELENKVYEVEMKLGIKPTLPEHELQEPEHKEIIEEIEHKEEPVKESNLEVKSDAVNTPPTTLPPTGFKYAWDPKNNQWILVQIEGATGGGY